MHPTSNLLPRAVRLHRSVAPQSDGLTTVVTGVCIVATLYFARDVLIPISLAVLISFVLAPLALALRRVGLSRGPAVIAVVVLTFGAILGIGAIGTSQISQLAEQLPQYQLNIRDKIRILKGATNSKTAAQATAVIEDIGKEISGGKAVPSTQQSLPPGSKDVAPIPVEIHTANSNPLKVAVDFLQPIISPLATTGLVILFVIFILLQREDLRDRVIKLLGTRELHRTTEAMDEAASRLSRYFFLQTLLNASFGAVIGLGLWFIGVPSPLLWGIFATLMRFVPYIGSLLAAVLPIALAAAVDPGWTMVIATSALFLIGEPLMGQAVEPLVFGHQTGLSPIAIVIAATFWTWLWGPIGLILATPLTLCLVLLGQYTQRLEFLHVLLGDQPALSPAESFYQRLIAGDPADIIDQAEARLTEMPLVQYCDDVALQGLVLAQRDAGNGELAIERQALLFAGVATLIEGLSENRDQPIAEARESDGEKTAPTTEVASVTAAGIEKLVAVAPSVLCVAGRGPIDQAAAALLVKVLEFAGTAATLGEVEGPLELAAMRQMHPTVATICISFVATARVAQARFMVRRLRRTFPEAKIVIGLWHIRPNDPEFSALKNNSGADTLVGSLREAVTLFTTDLNLLKALPSHAGQVRTSAADGSNSGVGRAPESGLSGQGV
jgi:predicted PurR-regulated permease PerM